MKTLILSLAAFLLTVTTYGQTLKWTHAIAQPPFNAVSNELYTMRNDALGNLGFSVEYGTESGAAQFTWIAANGKVLFSIIHTVAEKVNQPCVLSVSGTHFLVAFTNSEGTSWTLRKYIKRLSGSITHTDTVLSLNEYPARTATLTRYSGQINSFAPTDSTFFVVGKAQDGYTPLTIKRYTVK